MSDVMVVGSGPTGLMVAGELALAGVDVVVLERRRTAELVGSRAGGVHSRTLEILDQRGIVDRFLAEGQTTQKTRFASTELDLGDFPTRHPYGLGLWQNHIERILLGWVEELGVRIRRGQEVTGVVQDEAGVEVRRRGGEPLRARYLVGADGGRSTIRRAVGVDFVGWEATRSSLIAEVEVSEEIPTGVRIDATGLHALGPMGDGPTVRVVVTESSPRAAVEPDLAGLGAALRSVYGTDFGVHSPTWISRFTDATRQATAYRVGRVLLAGDSAHVHSPAGGQGIGLGVQDAVNLGWKLARVVAGDAPDALLDTYQAERHPAAARVLRHTMAQSVVQRADARIESLRDLVTQSLRFDGPRRLLAGLVSGLDVAYDQGEGHPLLGRRMPDLDLRTADGPLRVFTLLHDARPLLLDLGDPGGIEVPGWAERVRVVVAAHQGAWELPVLGAVPAPGAVLVRPDGHVAWVGEGTLDGLAEALERWLGPPAPTVPASVGPMSDPSAPLHASEPSATGGDGTEVRLEGHAAPLVGRRWPAREPAWVALLVHGYGEHVGRYEEVAARLTDAGAAVYGVDHVGHGRSGGERVVIEDFEPVVDDVHLLAGLATAEHPGLPVVLVGHSMGGLVGARYAQRHGEELAAVVLTGPVLGEWEAVTALLAAEEIPETPIDPATLSRDPAVGEAYVADPLVWHGAFKRPTLEALAVATALVSRSGPVTTVPVLWLHGEEDQLVPIEPSRAGWRHIAGPAADQRTYPGARHEILNETNRSEVLDDLLAFVARHVPGVRR